MVENRNCPTAFYACLPYRISASLERIMGYSRAGFQGERPGSSPRGLRKTDIGSTDFVEISASSK